MTQRIQQSAADLEATMQKVSLGIALVACGLMIAGSTALLLTGHAFSIPGPSVIPLPALVRLGGGSWSLLAMSAGIVLLALLPAVRAFLAMTIYLRQRNGLDTVAALIVVLELLLSMHI